MNQRLETAFMPDPELLIRTGGELRISNYMLWQIAYSELYFCDTYWQILTRPTCIKPSLATKLGKDGLAKQGCKWKAKPKKWLDDY